MECMNMAIIKNSVYLQNHFFCRTRALDLYRIRQYLLDNQYSIVDQPDTAEYLIVSTCGTVEQSTKKSIKQIEDLQRYDGEIIVIGCLPDTDEKEMDAVFKGKSIRNVDLNSLDRIFMKTNSYDQYKRMQTDVQNEEFCIEICRGCTEQCSYCAIRKAVGDLESLPVNECKTHIDHALSKRVKKIVLGAENSGAYGLDLGTNLSILLKSIELPKNSHILRINNLHPRYLVANIEAIKSHIENKTIGLLKVPIQSGSQNVLNAMKRNCSIDNIVKCISNIREKDSSVIFMTDIIIGFPGEENEDIKNTLEIVKRYFDIGRIFLFTPKANTEASFIKDSTNLFEKQKRLEYFLNTLSEYGMKVGMNDDSIHTFSKNHELFDINNPYTQDVFKLF